MTDVHAPHTTVPFDLYRDVHKGIRSELFAITSAAGSVSPSDNCAVETAMSAS